MSKPIFSAPVWANLLRGCGVASATAGKWSSVFSATLTDTSFSAGWRKELPDFLGQILHESVMLERLEENLNYTTPQRLMQVWPKRFPTVESAVPYVRQPQKLANFVYGSRLGNVNGDGSITTGPNLRRTAARELFEETGITVKPVDLLRLTGFVSRSGRPMLAYEAPIDQGALPAELHASAAGQPAWVPPGMVLQPWCSFVDECRLVLEAAGVRP